jgi:mannan endo-1,4-beta-mannosidase
MSSFIKSLDPNHLVAVGDEGFLPQGREEWGYDAPFGVNSESLGALSHVDFGTYHLYPDHWGRGPEWSYNWIFDHVALSRRLNKPVVLEEYGMRVVRTPVETGAIVRGLRRRETAYRNFHDILLRQGGQAALFWMLAGDETPGAAYPDFDGFTVYQGDDSARLLAGYAAEMSSHAAACTLPHAAGTPAEIADKSPYVAVRAPALEPNPSAVR